MPEPFEFKMNIVHITGNSLEECMRQIFAAFSDTEVSEDMEEAELKFRAGMLLADRSKRIIVPTADEWVGLNQLERDGELKRKKG